MGERHKDISCELKSEMKKGHGVMMLFTTRGRKYLVITLITLFLGVGYLKTQIFSTEPETCLDCEVIHKNVSTSHRKRRLDAFIEITSNQVSSRVLTEPEENTFQYINADFNRVFYNRVPKCGSRGVQSVIKDLAKKLDYNYKAARVYSPHELVNQTQESFVQEFLEYDTPFLYDRHLRFVDFTQFNVKQPVYINFIRDPFERIVSGFYFLKRSARRAGRYVSSERFDMTFDDCIRLRHFDCTAQRYTFKEIPFFCGHLPICNDPSDAALKQAKKNIERYYLVVGTTERMEDTFRVLESVMPDFFSGAAKIYEQKERSLHRRFKGAGKVMPSNSSREFMMPFLKWDYDLYRWVQQRFDKQYKAVMHTSSYRGDDFR